MIGGTEQGPLTFFPSSVLGFPLLCVCFYSRALWQCGGAGEGCRSAAGGLGRIRGQLRSAEQEPGGGRGRAEGRPVHRGVRRQLQRAPPALVNDPVKIVL